MRWFIATTSASTETFLPGTSGMVTYGTRMPRHRPWCAPRGPGARKTASGSQALEMHLDLHPLPHARGPDPEHLAHVDDPDAADLHPVPERARSSCRRECPGGRRLTMTDIVGDEPVAPLHEVERGLATSRSRSPP